MVIRKAPVPQTTHRERRKDGFADRQDQPHPASHLPTHTVQIGAPIPPAAKPNGAPTPAPQKVVDSVLLKARGEPERGAGGIVPLDLSGSGKEDAPDRETTKMEDPSRKDSRVELMVPRERGDRESMAEDRGASTLAPQKTVGTVVDPTTSDASRGLGGLVPLDLSIGGNRDESGSDTSKEEDPLGKNARRELEPLREKACKGLVTGGNGGSLRASQKTGGSVVKQAAGSADGGIG